MSLDDHCTFLGPWVGFVNLLSLRFATRHGFENPVTPKIIYRTLQSLGSEDCLTIGSRYHTVVIISIPVLKLPQKNQARRLNDALYEMRCRIICLAALAPSGNSHNFSSWLQRRKRFIVLILISSYDSSRIARAPVAPVSLPLDRLSIFLGE
jgi:peroxisome-assembly ATPase